MIEATRPAEPAGATTEPLGEALQAVAREIAQLAEVSDRLQALISAALVADGSRNADHMREFQAIDLLVQRLHGVSIFVDALSNRAPPHWRIDVVGAAAAVPLSDLARRLTGAGAGEASPALAEEDLEGDLELFG